MIKKTLIYGGLQLLIVFLITIYMESISNGSLLLTENILADDLRDKIINNPIKILGILGALNLLFYYLSHRTKENKELRNLYNNICQLVFDQFIKPQTTLQNSKFRVSLFKAKKGLLFRREKFFVPEYRTYLQNVGRYQTRQEKKLSKIKFLPKEGVVGLSYSNGVVLFEETVKYSKEKEEDYLVENLEKYALPHFKTKKLNDKSCAFIGCPIKFFKSDDLFGVIIVDCIEPEKLDNEQFRTIEKVVENYSVFFNANGI